MSIPINLLDLDVYLKILLNKAIIKRAPSSMCSHLLRDPLNCTKHQCRRPDDTSGFFSFVCVLVFCKSNQCKPAPTLADHTRTYICVHARAWNNITNEKAAQRGTGKGRAIALRHGMKQLYLMYKQLYSTQLIKWHLVFRIMGCVS